MILVKHKELGNKYAEESEVPELEKAGWVSWPRPKEPKVQVLNAEPVEQPEQVVAKTILTVSNLEPVVKRKPGRPKRIG